MNRGVLFLAAALVLTTLLAGWAAAGPNVAPQPASPVAMPTPQVLIGEAPAYKPLPPGCSPARVVGIVQAFVAAINQDDRAQLVALFRPDILNATGTPGVGRSRPQPGWFSAGHDAPEGDGVFARNGAALARWVAARHARGEHWTVLQLFMGGYWWTDGVNIAYNVRRQADDVPTQIVGGKGAIDCHHGTVFTWSLGGPPVLPPYLTGPGATPTRAG